MDSPMDFICLDIIIKPGDHVHQQHHRTPYVRLERNASMEVCTAQICLPCDDILPWFQSHVSISAKSIATWVPR